MERKEEPTFHEMEIKKFQLPKEIGTKWCELPESDKSYSVQGTHTD
jgi:hypothetical protein